MASKKKKPRTFVCDFETTVFEGQEFTEVWAAACVEIGSEDVRIFHSIGEQFEFFRSLHDNVVAYYHNLKFDGSFWLSYLLCDLGFEQASDGDPEKGEVRFLDRHDMRNDTFSYSISNMGQWYTVVIKTGGRIIELRDSLKLLPFSVKQIGKSFATKHKKLDMEYKGFRYAGCEITPEEREYIANDVLVVKEALEIMFSEGHSKLTIGACCMDEFKRGYLKDEYDECFPDVYGIELDQEEFGSDNAGDYIRRSYHGGWCYLVRGKECRTYTDGVTADVNSLYPSMMSAESGNVYPVGEPTFWTGDYIPDCAIRPDRWFVVRVRTRFYIRPGMLPCIQVKRNPLYDPTAWLDTSDVVSCYTGKPERFLRDGDAMVSTEVELTLTCTDWKLIKEHYELVDLRILDGCWFEAVPGVFDKYIDKYRTMKMESTGARRQLAKLFLNNLYGKMAASTNSSFQVRIR